MENNQVFVCRPISFVFVFGVGVANEIHCDGISSPVCSGPELFCAVHMSIFVFGSGADLLQMFSCK